jgi:predicted nucleic acid-binding Zn ribbon protein
MALIECNECKSQVSDKAKNCPKCGAPVVLIQNSKCFECGTILKKDARTCENCGAEQVKSKKSKKTFLYGMVGLGILVAVILTIVLNNVSTTTSPSNDPNILITTPETNTESPSEIQRPSPPPPPKPKTEEELKQELYQKEISNPKNYLSVQYQWRVNLGGNTILEGYVINNATIAGFKNVSIRASFYSKTDVLLGEETFTIMEFVPAGRSAAFRHKIIGWWKDATISKYTLLTAEPY